MENGQCALYKGQIKAQAIGELERLHEYSIKFVLKFRKDAKIA